MEGKRGNDLQALTEIADNDVLIVDTAGGTRAITYAQLCAAVKDTLGIREVVESTNITEPGFLMDGKTASEAFAELYSKFGYRNIMNEITILDSSAASVISAYAENGSVLILFGLRTGVHGSIQIAEINTQFAPRVRVGGTYVCLSSGMDAQKIPSAYIDEQGKVTVWFLEDLSYGERLTFVYPLRQ